MARKAPSNRNRLTCGHLAGPKVLAFALAMGFGVCFGLSLPVPDTIQLPDSLGPLRPGYHLAFGSSTSNIYVASESSDIIVVDGNTFQRIKRINTGTPVGSVLLVSQHNKLYCTYPSRGRIGIIDCITNDTVGSIQVSSRPWVLCYSSGTDKLYCGDSINGTVSVVDCSADTVRKVISTGYSPTAMVYEATTNKVYAATRDAVLAVSCVTDSIVANLDAIKYVSGLCLNKRRQKLYVVGRRQNDDPDTIYVVSPQSDSVIAAMHWGWDIVPSLACNEASDRLYAVTANNAERIREYDCLGDTYIRSAYTLGYECKAVACDTVRNRLFLRSEYDLLVLDCATFDVVADFGAPDYDTHSDLLAWDQARYRALCTGLVDEEGWGALTAYDCKGDTPCYRGGVPLCGWAHKMCHNPATSKLYCSLGTGTSAVIDELTNRQVGLARGISGGLVHSPTSNKFYFPYGLSDVKLGLGVMDGSHDSLIGVVEIGDNRWEPFPCWCPVGNKVYCFASTGARLYIAVVDCNTDSVVREMDVYDHGRWFEYLDNGLMLCNSSRSLTLIDAQTDSVLVDSSLAAGGIYAVTHTGDGEKVYLVRFGRLEVRSSSSLSLLKTVDWPYFAPGSQGTSLAYSDTTRKLYWFVGDTVLAIDATRDTVTARLATSELYSGVCLDRTGRYVFCASYDTLSVYDMRSDSLLACIQLQFPPLRIMSNPDLGYVYLACQDMVLVYPDAPPGIEEAVNDEREVMSAGVSVVRGVLFLPPTLLSPPSLLLSVDGRKVLDLKSGANDVRGLAPGVYFVRGPKTEDGRPGATVRKVVLTE
jgi:DNA-binding beta-propeller fold protein YncE